MPPGGAAARGRQLATLRKIAHEKLTDPRVGELIARSEGVERAEGPDSFAASLVRVARREFSRAVRVPSEFMAAFTRHTSATYDAWTRAKESSDFKAMIPFLEKTLELSREYSAFFPGAAHVADPLIDLVDEGVKADSVRALFAELRSELVPLVKAIACRPDVDASVLRGRYGRAEQGAFGEGIVRRFGYDFSRGRQDVTRHPFMIAFSIGDVRITTRFKDDDVTDALFSTMHEAGHAMYEQGVSPEFEGTPLARGTSVGVHESQSRLWENVVGRSLPFWRHFYPGLQKSFPDPLSGVPLDAFYRVINRVAPSLIRTEADEVTYNLHVMIRFDLELALLEGRLAVKDLSEAWNERYRDDLGVVPNKAAEGVMQDVHWFDSFIGGLFQCYTIGNVLSAQFFDAAVRAEPSIPEDVALGRFDKLHSWLKDNVYRFGARFTADEIVKRATGAPMTTGPYVSYLKGKYGELYGF
jgi:carboxypeptidase Taq